MRLLPIESCYQCDRRDVIECICKLKNLYHPPEGFPEWCPLLLLDESKHCKECGSQDTWFDRTISKLKNGSEGMCYRCSSCGTER